MQSACSAAPGVVALKVRSLRINLLSRVCRFAVYQYSQKDHTQPHTGGPNKIKITYKRSKQMYNRSQGTCYQRLVRWFHKYTTIHLPEIPQSKFPFRRRFGLRPHHSRSSFSSSFCVRTSTNLLYHHPPLPPFHQPSPQPDAWGLALPTTSGLNALQRMNEQTVRSIGGLARARLQIKRSAAATTIAGRRSASGPHRPKAQPGEQHLRNPVPLQQALLPPLPGEWRTGAGGHISKRHPVAVSGYTCHTRIRSEHMESQITLCHEYEILGHTRFSLASIHLSSRAQEINA